MANPRPILWHVHRKHGPPVRSLVLLQASLGLELNHQHNEISLRDPVLPQSLQELTIRNLKLGNTSLDLLLHRHGGDVTANVLKRSGSCAVSIVK